MDAPLNRENPDVRDITKNKRYNIKLYKIITIRNRVCLIRPMESGVKLMIRH